MSRHAAVAPTRQTATPEPASEHESALRRKCACGQHTVAGGECTGCRKQQVAAQRWSALGPRPDAMPRSTAAATLHAAGTRPGNDLSSVRTQTTVLRARPWLQRAARGAVESDSFAGTFAASGDSDAATPDPVGAAPPAVAPAEPAPRAGVAPSASATPAKSPDAPAPEAQPEGSPETAVSGQPTALLVEDDAAEVSAAQLRRSEFLDQLEHAVCAQADQALAAAGRSTDGCPYLAQAFRHYRGQRAARLESALRRYAPETRDARAAAEYVPALAARVRQGVERWVDTGEITGVPEGLSRSIPADGSTGAIEGLAPAIGSLLLEARGAARATDDPARVQAELGAGRPVESGIRSPMERAFGRSLSDVRMHTDAAASRLSSEQNARAFAIGGHVAFAAGEYRPGSVAGDALIAHELAHTLQQHGRSDPTSRPASSGGYGALEDDADRSAIRVVTSLWGATRGTAADVATNGVPRLRSGLTLQRCGPKRGTTTPSPPTAAATPSTGCPPRLLDPRWNVATTPVLIPRNGCSLQLAQSGGSGDGFTFHGDIDVRPVCSGSVYFVQNTRPQRTSVSCYENRPLGFCVRPEWGVDTGWPYALGSNISFNVQSGSETRRIQSVDSPGQRNISSPDTSFVRICIQDEFVTYVVFEAPDRSLTPLGWMNWRWNARAWRDRGVCTPAQTSSDCAGWQVTGTGEKLGESFAPGSMHTGMPLDRSRPAVDVTPQDCEATECPVPAGASAPASRTPATEPR